MTRRKIYRIPALLALLAAVPTLFPMTANAAADIDHGKEFSACMTLAEKAPSDALESALTWQDHGGGDLAKLCQAMALFHKGDFKAAGTRLEALVPTLGKDSPQGAASLLGRAGWAWLRAGDNARAERLYTQALERTPQDVDLYIDRAFARAEEERYWDALSDLDTALAKDPKRPDAYLYRAGAYQALANDRQALADVDQALALRPNDPDAILLRGTIKAQIGDLAGAKQDWTRVRRMAPDSSAARTAQVNLDRLAVANPTGPKTAQPLPESAKKDPAQKGTAQKSDVKKP